REPSGVTPSCFNEKLLAQRVSSACANGPSPGFPVGYVWPAGDRTPLADVAGKLATSCRLSMSSQLQRLISSSCRLLTGTSKLRSREMISPHSFQ
ncbi:MAG: hypothetical protein ABJJ13_07350, partial [Rhodopirellula bahusiensis]